MSAIGRARRRRIWFGLLTVLGVAERGYFIPHRYAAKGAKSRAGYPEIEDLFESRQAAFRETLRLLDNHGEALLQIGQEHAPAHGLGARWSQDWFPRLDAALAYVLTRARAPAQILEIGAGHSTRFFARAVADGGLSTRISTIDPAPRTALETLDIDLHRMTVQDLLRDGNGAVADLFAGLKAGDILSIDSSHILMPGSDVEYLLGRLLPRLPPGILIQIHDIFLPDDYPRTWRWRGYNEQLALLPLLLGGAFEVLFSSRYAATRMADDIEASVIAQLPLGTGEAGSVPYESSLWLRSRAIPEQYHAKITSN